MAKLDYSFDNMNWGIIWIIINDNDDNDAATKLDDDTAIQICDDTAIQLCDDTAIQLCNDTAIQLCDDTAIQLCDLQPLSSSILNKHTSSLSPKSSKVKLKKPYARFQSADTQSSPPLPHYLGENSYQKRTMTAITRAENLKERENCFGYKSKNLNVDNDLQSSDMVPPTISPRRENSRLAKQKEEGVEKGVEKGVEEKEEANSISTKFEKKVVLTEDPCKDEDLDFNSESDKMSQIGSTWLFVGNVPYPSNWISLKRFFVEKAKDIEPSNTRV
ncbi:hypothetical protein KGF56_001902 [Candida oxycetoniae]|uniref:Uncharacterized protein n=1 Tax=Candida oxycetoniae TaxID=497107 RepID=A0AAI9WYE8_9ASCO|nr:uncharacterized protein KGF56_001902 [Candida oxycetoniae]KAI3405290.2 hypothetical protein KGF56_001902 [Candida oxycetoniae]